MGNFKEAETAASVPQKEDNVKIFTRVDKSSGTYRIIEAGTAITFSMQTGILFTINFNTKDNNDLFAFIVEVSFKTDSAKKERRLKFETDANKNIIHVQCINFEPLGAGTAQPIEIGKYLTKKVYMHLWVYELGGTAGRKIEYCFYME